MRKLLLLCLLCPFLLSAQINKDSLWSIWEDEQLADSTRLEAIKTLVQHGYLFSQPDTAFTIAQTMYDFAAEKEQQKWMEAASNYQGISLAIRGRHREAIFYFNQCLELNEKLGNNSRLGGILNNIGNLYEEIEDSENALDYYNRSLNIYEQEGDINGQALVLGNIATQHSQLGNHDKSLPLAQRSLKLFEQLKDKKGIGNVLSSIGSIYGSLGDTAQTNNLTDQATHYYNLALDHFQQALIVREQAGDKDGISITLNGMGRTHIQLGNNASATEILERSLVLAEEVGSTTSIRTATSELHHLYKSQGKFKEALEMFEYYTDINDRVLSEENQRAIIRQEYDFEYKQQALADSLSQAEEALQLELAHQTELRRKDQIRDLLLMLSIAIVLVSIGLWSRNRYIRLANEQLAIAKERAERSEKYKEQFLANMSHEIRTPMHAISGMVNILTRKKHPSFQDPYLQAMQTNSDNLMVILNDILDLSKIEAGYLQIENTPINPEDVIKNIVQIFQYKAEEKGLRLTCTVEKHLPTLIIGDATRLNQIITNLLSNAIKFTDKGQIAISLSKLDDQYQVQIKDTGIGIPPDQIDHIFGEFEQAQLSNDRGGTGLGLSIVKQLVELQNGSIHVESQFGSGSTFTVSLPLIPATEVIDERSVFTEEKLQAMANSLRGLRILLADDNPFNQMIAKDDLEYHIENVQISTVETGSQAVEHFQYEQVDLILMDVQMPEMDGIEATLKIRGLESQAQTSSPIPIIAMTASLMKSEIAKCYEAGSTSYISKPYKIKDLIGEVYKCYTGN